MLRKSEFLHYHIHYLRHTAFRKERSVQMSSALDAWRTNLGIENHNENQDTKIMNQTIVTCFSWWVYQMMSWRSVFAKTKIYYTYITVGLPESFLWSCKFANSKPWKKDMTKQNKQNWVKGHVLTFPGQIADWTLCLQDDPCCIL